MVNKRRQRGGGQNVSDREKAKRTQIMINCGEAADYKRMQRGCGRRKLGTFQIPILLFFNKIKDPDTI